MLEELSSEQFNALVNRMNHHQQKQMRDILIRVALCAQPDSQYQGVAVFNDNNAGRIDFFSINADEETAFGLLADVLGTKVLSGVLAAHEGPMQ